MKTYQTTNWLYFVRTWLYFPGEFVDLLPQEVDRYAAQIEQTEDGRYKAKEGFFLQVARTFLYRPGENVELSDEEALRYSDRIICEAVSFRTEVANATV